MMEKNPSKENFNLCLIRLKIIESFLILSKYFTIISAELGSEKKEAIENIEKKYLYKP
tara:strand:+ start:2355 stop:2528 length:174 start_codon:yes stop_codon:yes gene_type:complete